MIPSLAHLRWTTSAPKAQDAPFLDHASLQTLRRHHPAWRLLCSDHAPIVVGFLHAAFIRTNTRTLKQSELEARLEDYLFGLRDELGANMLPRSAVSYLCMWADEEHGWLRRYYDAATDEPRFDITPASESAIEWLSSLESPAQFVGTESRLNTIFELLRQIAYGTEQNPQARLEALRERRGAIDDEIALVEGGQLHLLAPASIRERFLQVEQTARALLGDFRQLEQSFRELDLELRERIAMWDGTKGELLERLFGDHDAIADSDQGRSFRAFWDFLMSPDRRDELSALLEKASSLEALAGLRFDPRLMRMHFDWLDASETVQRTVARLSGQLRKYLDDQAWLENRRIMAIIRNIEQHALVIRGVPPKESVMAIDALAPTIGVVMDRPLFSPPFAPNLERQPVPGAGADVDTSALFEQVYVDRAELEAELLRALASNDQVSLRALLERRPLTRGLAELVAWLGVAADSAYAYFDDGGDLTVAWTGEDGTERRASLPTVLFRRPEAAP